MKLRMWSAALMLGLLLWAPAAMADRGPNPFYRDCGAYRSGKDFVRTASYYCVQQKDAAACQQAARAYFSMCGYQGDYQKLSREAYTGMLFMFVVARAPQVADSVPHR